MSAAAPSAPHVVAPAVPSRRQLAGAAAFFVALTALMTWPQVVHLGDRVANHRDAFFSVWRVSWVVHALASDPAHLFDANIFHPEPRTLALSDGLLLPAAIGAPMLWAGADRIVVYNLLLLAGFAASGVGAFLLAYGLTGRTSSALLAGVIFAFAPYRFDHYQHLELQWAMWMPLGLWGLHRVMATGAWQSGSLVGATLALQMMSAMYYGVFFGVYLLALAPLAWVAGDKKHRNRAIGRTAAGLVVAGFVLIPYLWPYARNHSALGGRNPGETASFSARWTDYIASPEENLLYGGTSERWGGSERRLFPGVAAVALAGAALAPPWSAATCAYVAGGALAVEMSRGMNGTLYPWLYHHASPFRGLRAPARFGILVLLSMAVLAAIGLARVIERVRSPRARAAIAAVAVALAIVEYRSAPELTTVPRQLPPVYEWLRRQPPTVVAELPLPIVDRAETVHEDMYMYYSTFHWHRLVNGTSGYYPASYLALLDRMRSFPDTAGLDALRQRGVETIVVHEAFYTPDRYGAVVAWLNEQPGVEAVGRFPGPSPASAFRVSHVASPATAPR